MYGFNNPDKSAWVAKLAPKSEQFFIAAAENAVKRGRKDIEAVNIHGLFVGWFLWGFYLMLAPWAIFLITLFSCYISERAW